MLPGEAGRLTPQNCSQWGPAALSLAANGHPAVKTRPRAEKQGKIQEPDCRETARRQYELPAKSNFTDSGKTLKMKNLGFFTGEMFFALDRPYMDDPEICDQSKCVTFLY